MALYKEVIQEDGIITSYHRIVYLRITTNRQNSVSVLSYVDGNARNRIDDMVSEPYVKAVTYETDYDENMTIEDAYNYLKTLPEFKGATDI